jgi:hypothetical protein
MSERTLAEPLSGAEVIERILEEVRRKLKNDCFLNPVFAYQAFSCSGHVRVQLKDAGSTPEVLVQFQAASENPVDEDAFLSEAEIQIGEAPPNTVREDAGSGIPTLVTGPDGKPEIKRQIYNRKTQGRAMAGLPEKAPEGGDGA